VGAVVLGQILTVVGAAEMVILSGLVVVCTGLLASLTCTVKLKTPTAVGVPLITPLFTLSPRPVGRDPFAIDHKYGVVPPLAVSAAE
jgi:hypothetical protein